MLMKHSEERKWFHFSGMALLLPVLLVGSLLFTGCKATNTAPPQQAPAPQQREPSFKYLFAHRILPQGLHGTPQSALLLAFSQEGDIFLNAVWEQYKRTNPEFAREVASPPKVIQRGFLAKELAFFIIEMPTPEVMPEAYYALVIVALKRDAKKQALDARQIWYYTLEKTMPVGALLAGGGSNTAQAQQTATVIGQWTNEPRHLNFGPGPAPGDPKAFAAAVFALFRAKAQENASVAPGAGARGNAGR